MGMILLFITAGILGLFLLLVFLQQMGWMSAVAGFIAAAVFFPVTLWYWARNKYYSLFGAFWFWVVALAKKRIENLQRKLLAHLSAGRRK